jgi:two-component system LytT family sensor kinase
VLSHSAAAVILFKISKMLRSEPEISKNIKWRKQELIFVTGITVIAIAGSFWNAFTFQLYLKMPFEKTNTAFNLYRNVIFPQAGSLIALYLTYLLFSLYCFPQFLKQRQKKSTNLLKVWLPVVLAAAVLGVVFNISAYFAREWQFNYEGFSIFFNKYNPRSQLGLGTNFVLAEAIVILYLLYVAIREVIILMITRSRKAALNISISNKVTAFFFMLIGFYLFLVSFGSMHEQLFLGRAVLVISGIFATFISNVYWIFPAAKSASLVSKRVLVKLLPTTFVYAMPFVIFQQDSKFGILYCWMLQLFIITPLTWLYYQYNKETILRLNKAETALQKSKASLQFLRSQVNPHFLFNALNTLYGTALQENAAKTSEGIQMLGDMMRFMLHENNQDHIGMDKEIAYLRNYITLQKLRTDHSKSIRITDNIADQQCNHQIAPMLLIPFVENAFKHGISLNEPSWISIELFCSAKNILFKVTNSLHEFSQRDPEKNRSGVGLTNVKDRLNLLYPGRHELQIDKSEKEFAIVLSINPQVIRD